MPAVRPVTISIDAPAHHVWDIVGPGFDHIGDWASAITRSTIDPDAGTSRAPGTTRSCSSSVPGVPSVSEQLTAYDPDAMTLTYVATAGMPGFVTLATNTWTVTADGPARCHATIAAQVEVKGTIARTALAVLAPNLQRMGRRTLDDLRHYAEHGEPSPRKRRQQARARSRTKSER